MGCGSSAQAVQPAPAKPPEVVTIIREPAPAPEPVVIKEIPKPPTIQDDPDASQPEVFMRQCVSLGWLQDLAKDPKRGAMTLDQLTRDVVKPATAARNCRYVETFDKQECGPPTYWVWVEDVWHHTMADLVQMLLSHVQMVEQPNQDASRLGIWLDCVCCHANSSRVSREAAREAARTWLSEGSSLRPTLVCMQRGVTRTGNTASHALATARQEQRVHVHTLPSEPGVAEQPHSLVTAAEEGAQQPSEDWLKAVSDLRKESKGRLGAQEDGARHEAVLMLWRSVEGVYGFQKAQLDTLNVVYLN